MTIVMTVVMVMVVVVMVIGAVFAMVRMMRMVRVVCFGQPEAYLIFFNDMSGRMTRITHRQLAPPFVYIYFTLIVNEQYY